MHEPQGFRSKLRIFFWRAGLADVYLEQMSLPDIRHWESQVMSAYHRDIKVVQVSPTPSFRLDNIHFLENEWAGIPDI